LPHEPDAWTLVKRRRFVSWWADGRRVLTTSELRENEREDFLIWLREEAASFDVDPPNPWAAPGS
jgi:hypothetical protein